MNSPKSLYIVLVSESANGLRLKSFKIKFVFIVHLYIRFAELLNSLTSTPSNTAQVVWQKDDVTVSATRSTHVPGHASYRVDTPAGSVVIGGDAGNDARKPPRATSTSDQVETLSKDGFHPQYGHVSLN